MEADASTRPNAPGFFREGHFLGKPAEFAHRIVRRRTDIVRGHPGFTGPSLDLLDVGCGNGATMLLLADAMRSCLGLETEETHRAAFEAERDLRGVRNCEFRVFDIERDRLDRTYDRIVSFEVIEHLRDERSVRFYGEALRPGGMAAISVPNKWWLFETHGTKLPGFRRHRTPFASWLPTPIHERISNARIYTVSRIVTLLESAGLRAERTEYITAPLDVLPDGAMKRFLDRHVFKGETTGVPFLSTSIMVICRKP